MSLRLPLSLFHSLFSPTALHPAFIYHGSIRLYHRLVRPAHGICFCDAHGKAQRPDNPGLYNLRACLLFHPIVTGVPMHICRPRPMVVPSATL